MIPVAGDDFSHVFHSSSVFFSSFFLKNSSSLLSAFDTARKFWEISPLKIPMGSKIPLMLCPGFKSDTFQKSESEFSENVVWQAAGISAISRAETVDLSKSLVFSMVVFQGDTEGQMQRACIGFVLKS